MTKEQLENVEKIGKAIKAQLDHHWNQWRLPLNFKSALNKYYAKAGKMDLDVNEIAIELDKQGVIRLISSPSTGGRRYVFPGGLPETNDELLGIIQTIESNRELEKQFKNL